MRQVQNLDTSCFASSIYDMNVKTEYESNVMLFCQYLWIINKLLDSQCFSVCYALENVKQKNINHVLLNV